MSRLIPPHWDERRLVDHDVGGLENRVREEPVVDVVGLLRLLFLVCRRSLEPAHRRHRAQEPGQLCVLRTVALDEERAPVGIQPEREQSRRHLAGLRPEQLRVMRARERVVVDDAVDRLVLGLERDVVSDRPEVVAEMKDPRRLDAREDAVARRRLGSGGGHGPRVYPSARPAGGASRGTGSLQTIERPATDPSDADRTSKTSDRWTVDIRV